MSLLRKVRGLLGTAVTWAIAWIPLGLIPIALIELLSGRPLHLAFLVRIAGALGVVGAISGLAFGTILAIAERRHTLSTVSARRVAFWGSLGALLAPGVSLGLFLLRDPDFFEPTMALRTLGISCLLGAACAGGTLYLARRAPGQLEDSKRDRALPNVRP
jgi:hypothetical protein